MTPGADGDAGTAGSAGPAGDAAPARTAGRPRVDSRWWYWIAVVPVYYVLVFALGVWFFVVAVVSIGLTVGTESPGPFLGLGVFAAVVGVLAALAGLVLLFLFPVALYLDAEAVAAADLDWQPDSLLYALVGLAGALTTGYTVSAAVAVYYLYRRHRHVGVP